MELNIVNLSAMEILDSRGNPTLEVTCTVQSQVSGMRFEATAGVPSGASTGTFEAVELRDGEKRYNGLGTSSAVRNVNTHLRQALLGVNALDQIKVDHLMIQLDGTENKSRLGANAILGTSLAVAKVAAKALGLPLYKYFGGSNVRVMPVPMMNIINGGVHAKNNLDFQEFMIMPVNAKNFEDCLKMGAEIYHALKKVLQEKGLSTGVGDEGGFAPNIAGAEEALILITEAVEKAGYKTGEDIVFAMDVAASELYQPDLGFYYFPGETKAYQQLYLQKESVNQNYKLEKMPDTEMSMLIRTSDDMIDYYEMLCRKFPIVSIEDGLYEEDWEGWKKLTEKLGDKIQLVGDDLFVTNTKRLLQGIELGCANSILIKLNQIGTLTETIDAIKMAQKAGYSAIISHRSGETEDTTIADLSVALSCGQIKSGAPCRSERVAKYNRLLKIEKEIGSVSVYPGISSIRCSYAKNEMV